MSNSRIGEPAGYITNDIEFVEHQIQAYTRFVNLSLAPISRRRPRGMSTLAACVPKFDRKHRIETPACCPYYQLIKSKEVK
jgi:hypothetical protein